MPNRRSACLVALLPALLSCGGDPAAPPPEPPPPVPDELNAFYEEMIAHTSAFMEADGQWLEDYGDAPFYGPGFYAREGDVRGDSTFAEIADRGRAHNLEIVRQANADRDWYLANMEEAMMAALGLIEVADATGHEVALEVMRVHLDVVLTSLLDLESEPHAAGRHVRRVFPAQLLRDDLPRARLDPSFEGSVRLQNGHVRI